jgi:hypothetical protein
MEHDEALKEIGELSAAVREFLQGIGLSGEFMILLNQEDGMKLSEEIVAPLSIHADGVSRTFSKHGANFLFHFNPSF